MRIGVPKGIQLPQCLREQIDQSVPGEHLFLATWKTLTRAKMTNSNDIMFLAKLGGSVEKRCGDSIVPRRRAGEPNSLPTSLLRA